MTVITTDNGDAVIHSGLTLKEAIEGLGYVFRSGTRKEQSPCSVIKVGDLLDEGKVKAAESAGHEIRVVCHMEDALNMEEIGRRIMSRIELLNSDIPHGAERILRRGTLEVKARFLKGIGWMVIDWDAKGDLE